MNTFRQKKICSAPPRKPLSEKAKQNLVTALGVVLIILVLYYSGLKLLETLGGTRIVDFLTGIFGKELVTDDQGHTNILLLGVGGEGHEGKDLTDTIIVASIDHTNRGVSMLSLPRDLYIESSLGGSRINRLYEKGLLKWNSEQGIDFVRATVEDVLNVPIHYTAKVDFEAFEKIIDAVGGIDIFVEQTINDPQYPRDGTYDYETFFLAQGNQHLDGKTALKYVRSRKTSSDFDRSKRQQQVLLALKNKAAEQNFFGRKRFLQQLYYSLQEHVETNLSMREMLSLADFAVNWDSKNLVTATLNDEPIFRGGFLYTPLRELYGGAFVLLPAGDNFSAIRNFAKLVFYGPKNYSQIPVAVLNGTEVSGLAAKGKSILHRFGAAMDFVGNARSKDIAKTVWYTKDEEAKALLPFLQTIIPGQLSSDIPQEYQQNLDLVNAKIILELGKDAPEIIEKADIFRNIVPLVPAEGTSSPATPEAS